MPRMRWRGSSGNLRSCRSIQGFRLVCDRLRQEKRCPNQRRKRVQKRRKIEGGRFRGLFIQRLFVQGRYEGKLIERKRTEGKFQEIREAQIADPIMLFHKQEPQRLQEGRFRFLTFGQRHNVTYPRIALAHAGIGFRKKREWMGHPRYLHSFSLPHPALFLFDFFRQFAKFFRLSVAGLYLRLCKLSRVLGR